MKTYWWILDEWGCMNFFDSYDLFRHARNHIHGLTSWDAPNCDSFQADNVKGCWKEEDVYKWKDSIQN